MTQASANRQCRARLRSFAERENASKVGHFRLFIDIRVCDETGSIGRLAEMGYKTLAAQPKGEAAVAPLK